MQCTVIQEQVYKAKEKKIVVIDDRLYDLRALKSAEFKEMQMHFYMFIRDSNVSP